jgi:hypothetical protein
MSTEDQSKNQSKFEAGAVYEALPFIGWCCFEEHPKGQCPNSTQPTVRQSHENLARNLASLKRVM